MEETEEEGDMINCEEMGAKNFESLGHGLLEGDVARPPKADLSAPHIPLLPTEAGRGGRAENLAPLLSLFLLPELVTRATVRAMESIWRSKRPG